MDTKHNWLPPLALFCDQDNNWNNYLDFIYKVFRKDFVDSSPSFCGDKICLKRHPISHGKEATFWHLISTGKDESDRKIDMNRCERISWPRSVIDNHFEEGVKVWENSRRSETRVLIWVEKAEYLVVLAWRKGYLLIWTAYSVTRNHRKRKLQAEFENYKKTSGT